MWHRSLLQPTTTDFTQAHQLGAEITLRILEMATGRYVHASTGVARQGVRLPSWLLDSLKRGCWRFFVFLQLPLLLVQLPRPCQIIGIAQHASSFGLKCLWYHKPGDSVQRYLEQTQTGSPLIAIFTILVKDLSVGLFGATNFLSSL